MHMRDGEKYTPRAYRGGSFHHTPSAHAIAHKNPLSPLSDNKKKLSNKREEKESSYYPPSTRIKKTHA